MLLRQGKATEIHESEGAMTQKLREMVVCVTEVDSDDEPDIPRLVGRCVIVAPFGSAACLKRIYANDIEAVELEKRGEFACSDCTNRLLTPRPVINLPDKIVKKSHHKKPDRQPGPRKVFL